MTFKRGCEEVVCVSGDEISQHSILQLCLLTWPLNESEARVDLVLIETTAFLS